MSTVPISTSRSTILEVAVRMFGQRGYSGTSMRDIAKAVGVLPGSLYAHIESKETLLVEIVDEGIQSFLTSVEPIAKAEGPADVRLREAIRAHVEVVAESPERSLVVFHQWRFLTGEKLDWAIAQRRRYEQAFVAIVLDGEKAGVFDPNLRVRIPVLTMLGALNWIPEWYSSTGPSSPFELAEMMADVLIKGLAARPDPS